MNSRYLYKFVITVIVCIAFMCLALILFSCSPYKRIAKNANPTDNERTLLAIACAREFPVITNTYNIDSLIKSKQKDYTKQIDSLVNVTQILDSIIHQQIPIIDTAFVDSSNCIPRIKIAYSQIEKLNTQRSFLQASLNHLKNQIFNLKMGYEPCDSVKYSTKVITVCDSARMQLLQDGFRGKSDSLLIMATKWKDAKETAKNRLFWVIGLVVALAGLIFLWVRSKKNNLLK